MAVVMATVSLLLYIPDVGVGVYGGSVHRDLFLQNAGVGNSLTFIKIDIVSH